MLNTLLSILYNIFGVVVLAAPVIVMLPMLRLVNKTKSKREGVGYYLSFWRFMGYSLLYYLGYIIWQLISGLTVLPITEMLSSITGDIIMMLNGCLGSGIMLYIINRLEMKRKI